MIVRLAIVAALIVALVAVRFAYRRWQARIHADDRPTPRVPAPVLAAAAGAERTWVVFTTPYCATCEPAIMTLRSAFPDWPVVKVDVSDRPDLARDFRIMRAPTVLLSDSAGHVEQRLVGPEAVTAYVQARPVPAGA